MYSITAQAHVERYQVLYFLSADRVGNPLLRSTIEGPSSVKRSYVYSQLSDTLDDVGPKNTKFVRLGFFQSRKSTAEVLIFVQQMRPPIYSKLEFDAPRASNVVRAIT